MVSLVLKIISLELTIIILHYKQINYPVQTLMVFLWLIFLLLPLLLGSTFG